MQRESAWKKQQSVLEEDSNNLSILKKEITKQSEIDASVQFSISQKIEALKQNATVLAKKLQNEKHKNVELETIITHLKNSLQKEKLQEASFRDTSSSESISGLENKFKKYQYDLGQLNGKANRISENVEEKRNKINQNRTERVIDSGIFRNIEKELIQSELKFKKLLIQKIKYQKEYERLLKNYEDLKEHAEIHNEQKQNKYKYGNSDNFVQNANDATGGVKKFINIETFKDTINVKQQSMTYIEEQEEFQEQKNIIVIKKLLSQTGLENCEELLYLFEHIDQINEKYFNEMMVYVDQSNEIEKYLNEFRHYKTENKLHFYDKARKPTKSQTYKAEDQKYRSSIDETLELTRKQMDQITNFFYDSKFKQFMSSFQLKQCKISEGEQNLDELKNILQQLQSQIQNILSKETINRDEKYKTARSSQHEKLEELINRVRKTDENLNVMGKQEFQEEYHKILKTSVSKTSILKPAKRQSSIKVKKS